MPKPFDPYYKWLSIQPSEQPPHHYRLLGTVAFEDDSEVIANAADRQMAHLRTFQTGPNAAEAQKLFNEVAAARVCLLDPKKKGVYDEQLRRQLVAQRQRSSDGTASEVAVPQATPMAFIAPQPAADPVPAPKPLPGWCPENSRSGPPANITPNQFSKGRPRRKLTWVIPASVGAAVMIVCVVWYSCLRNGGNKRPVSVAAAQPKDTGTAAGGKAVRKHPGGRQRTVKKPGQSPEASTSTTPVHVPDDEAAEGDEQAGDTNRGAETTDDDQPPRNPTKSELSAAPSDDTPRTGTKGSAGEPARYPDGGQTGAAANSASNQKPRSLADLLDDSGPKPAAPIRRPPRPDVSTLQSAAERVETLFGAEAKNAKTPQAQLALARKLLFRARWNRDAPEVRYILLLQARDAAVRNGDAVTACRACEAVAEMYDVPDLLRERANIVLNAESMRSASDELAWSNTLLALSLADGAAHFDRFDVANSLVRSAIVTSRSRSRAFREKTLAFKKSLQAREKRLTAYKQAHSKLKNNASDHDAKLAAGRYESLVNGEWRAGAARWQELAEPRLDELLTLEAKARRSAPDRMAAARTWWNAALTVDPAWKADYQLQAKYWCLRAGAKVPFVGLSGDDGAWVADALSIAGYPHGRLRGGLVAQLYNGGDFQQFRLERIDRNIDRTFGDRSPDPLVNSDWFSIRWTGWLKPPIAGTWRFVGHSEDGIRLWIDGRKLFESWNVGEQTETQDLDLDDNPHSLRIEYNERWAGAFVDLSWCFVEAGEQGRQPIPPESLFHDPAAPYDWPSVK